jgi:hypothetical protein
VGLPVGWRPVAGRWLLPTAIATALLYAWYIQRASFELDGHRGFSLFDDAMISMRYARNLAHGAGLRWNVGAPPVEGYSNLLWTLWMDLLQLLPIPQRSVSLWVSVTSAALLVLNLWLVRALVVRAGGRTASAVLAVTFSALSYPLVFWSLRGLEVGLLAFLLDAALLLAWRAEETRRPSERWLLAVVLSAMVLVRDDALVSAVVVLAFLAADRRTRPAATVSAIAVVTVLLAHLAFRLTYYGAPLPNTYYLKLTGIPIGARLARGVVAVLRTSLAELLLPLVLASFALVGRPRDRRAWMLTAIVAAQLTTTVFVGGDAWEAWGQPNRFISVALPALMVGAALGAEALWTGRPHRRYAMVFALALAWRAYAIAAGDFVPRSFTVTPPVELHGGLRGLADPLVCALLVAIITSAIVLATRRPARVPAWLAAALATVVLAATVGTNWRSFLGGELTARQIRWDGENAVFGTRLGELAPRTTTIAVVAAGAIPFFSNLPAVDLLGKNDAHIAREAPLERFIPGHDKRDYAYSLATYRPDVVLELWHHAPDELRQIAALGYQSLPNGMYVPAGRSDDLVDLVEHRLPAYPFTTHRPIPR